jgi:hypothetical protein
MPAHIIFQSRTVNNFITNKFRTSVNRKQLHVSAIVFSHLQGAPIYTVQIYAKVVVHVSHPDDIQGVCVCVCVCVSVSFWFRKSC